MAEFVEYRMEEMTPELIMMENLGLFTHSEVQGIAKKRKEFEYKIQRRTKRKEDFQSYVQYELDLIQLIRLKGERLGIDIKRPEMDYAIANRVKKIVKEACMRFQNDVEMWLSGINFLKKMEFKATVSQMLMKMLQFHGSQKPSLWKFAADCEMEANSIENARRFVLRGLRFHPESILLYTEAFRLELMFAAMMRQKKIKEESKVAENEAEKALAGLNNALDVPSVPDGAQGVMVPLGNIGIAGEASRDQIMEGKLAMVMYESAVDKIKNIGFIISLLSIAKDDLLNYFPTEELTWDTMARRELEGLSFSPIDPSNPITSTMNSSNSGRSNVLGANSTDLVKASCSMALPHTPVEANKSKERTKKTLKERIRSCCSIYDAAVKKLKTKRMWALYIECLLELLGNCKGKGGKVAEGGRGRKKKGSSTLQANPFPLFTKNLLLKAFREAHNYHKMTEKYYLIWMDIIQADAPSNSLTSTPKKGLKGSKGKASAVVEAGPNKVNIGKRKHKRVARLLAAATERLPHSAELWMTRLNHHITHAKSKAGKKGSEAKEMSSNDMDVSSGTPLSASEQKPKVLKVELLFSKAISKLGDVPEALPIWRLMLLYTQTGGDQAQVEALYQNALQSGPVIASAFKPLYLEWLVLTKGIIAARKVYDQISVLAPLCLELHTKMAHLETIQPKVIEKHVRKCYELACDQFGKSNADIWLDYIKFEMWKGSPENITTIYSRAVKMLDNLLGDIFTSEFSLLKTGMGAEMSSYSTALSCDRLCMSME
ncbi:hypothetical protein J437_LFUL002940 [Ladona fulva]|uniref:U3 small nucleolar RNA-associated protein 6 homolog n=1 Tax=Ladona fulva TaxID=123851 RepID=A0A8K0KEK7_LADFU|nr:hypothetical protein J437_LFUL002940 [Ladona fulva]